ncbi:acyl-CoA dehydrogenase family protein [Paenibacillus sp. JCM 10914]|uniref:acyl-CoA dehydrogenase family protein n=1 Tax=Paenibacillus sp. JCM 10914 TaxID=1236974 RepID=UPI0003CCABC8|nr:acyl-CoA dehydrogenase family protein [Paenibacillus sp. JCM 10914]GAE08067.1 acyl-CoA dehydrogenase [Paenibacillus sp. JCM 10914]
MSQLTAGKDFIYKAEELARYFEEDASERDKKGGTPKAQRDALRKSGLLNALIPQKWGGLGLPWSSVMTISRVLSTADSSLGHLFGYHNLAITYTLLGSDQNYAQRLLERSAANDWFWGNAANPLDQGLAIVQRNLPDEGFIANGSKSFASGSPDSDVLTLIWTDSDGERRYLANIPTAREGVRVHDDWDHIGQRQTGSGTVRFHNVIIHPDEISPLPFHPDIPASTIGPILSQSVLTQIFIGCALGALKEGKRYTREKTRAWGTSGVDSAFEDPYILRHYGEYWTETEAAASLADRSLSNIDQIWEKGKLLTWEERGEAAALAAAANVFAGKVSLEVTSRFFEVMGARSAAQSYGFDRFWRNVRTHTLHNPADYKLRTVGNWHLNDKGPEPSSYS